MFVDGWSGSVLTPPLILACFCRVTCGKLYEAVFDDWNGVLVRFEEAVVLVVAVENDAAADAAVVFVAVAAVCAFWYAVWLVILEGLYKINKTD